MDPFQIAHQTIDSALQKDRIGTPVAVRIIALAAVDHGRIEPLLARALESAGGWLRAKPARLFARGSIESGHITVQVVYESGQTALVSAGSPGTTPPFVDVLIAGNRGVLSWASDRGGPAAASSDRSDDISAEGKRLAQAARASLAARRPVDVATGVPTQPPSETISRATTSPPVRTDPKTTSTNPTPQKPPYGVLLVAGAYTHQEMYVPGFLDDSRCRLIGLADDADVPPRRKKLNAQMAESLGIPLLPNLDDALRRNDVHIVSMCAEPERRAPLIVRCAKAGKHVYLDKPLTTSMREADAIVAAFRQARVVQQMFSLVHTDFAQRAKAVFESGALGELTAIHCDAFFAKGMAGTAQLGKPRAETARPKNFETVDSKRELYNVGVYSLVQVAWLLRKPVRAVYGVTANYFFQEHQKNDMEDFAQLAVEFDGGPLVTVNVGRTGWRSHPMSGVNRMYFVGAKATACVDAFVPRVDVWADEDPWPLPRRSPDDPMGFWVSSMKEAGVMAKRAWVTPADATTDTRYFLDCVEQGRTSDVPAELAAVRAGSHPGGVPVGGDRPGCRAAAGSWLTVHYPETPHRRRCFIW